MNYDDIKILCEKSEVYWSQHCLKRMFERGIKRNDIKECIRTGTIIEEYKDDYPHPSCLICGQDTVSRLMHVVIGTDNSKLYIITAYYPSKDHFESDLKTRKAR